jgi:uncharacterized protein YdeI (YjbR/CyaY-like superfamily)
VAQDRQKGSGLGTVSFAEALEVALCYGWIDSQADRFDEKHWLQRFTPRRARSRWSKRNRAKAAKLIERGMMKPAGLRRWPRMRRRRKVRSRCRPAWATYRPVIQRGG